MATVDHVERFARLAFFRRSRALTDIERVELDELVQQLSVVIEGFHPPRRARKRAQEGPAEQDPFEEKTDPLSAPTKEHRPSAPTGRGDLPPNVRSIDLPPSAYTPRREASYLDDYFGEGFRPDRTGELPRMLIGPDGQPIEATGDLARLVGLEPEADEPPAETPARAKPAAQPKVMIHLVRGGVERGALRDWPPEATVNITKNNGAQAEIAVGDVLVAFALGVPAAPREGISVRVTLLNDKALEGFTADYAKGGSSFTLALDPPRAGVDAVWVPAHSVKAIGRR